MATCPICRRKPVVEAYKPFCSRRCADVDLQRWFSGGYVIPGAADEPHSDDGEED
ncbi:MAG: DNA gyrase inhibitor YacG [Brevundimonas sp.]